MISHPAPGLGTHAAAGRSCRSEAAADRIDSDVRKLISERCEIVTKLLGNAREKRDKLAETLLREEVREQFLGTRTGGQ